MRRTRLRDLGERRIVRELLAPRYGRNAETFGDDVCIAFSAGDITIVASSDPAPRPAAWDLGEPVDYFDWGWLLAALNLSDLAAAGAAPLGLVTSLALPADWLVRDFKRLLDGIDACCTSHNTAVLGGNLKDDAWPRCEATAIGIIQGSRPMSRTGATAGDNLVAFGPIGMFWSAIVARRTGIDLSESARSSLRRSLVRPEPRLALGNALRSSGVAKSCTDASDGLYAAIAALSSEHGLGFIVDPAVMEFPSEVVDVAARSGVNPVRLALGFGGLELVAAVSPTRTKEALDLARSLDVHATLLGQCGGAAGIRILRHGRERALNNFDNERFVTTSQFEVGTEAYVDWFLQRPLEQE